MAKLRAFMIKDVSHIST